MEESKTVYLRSELGVEECLRRLREATDRPKWQFFFPLGYGGTKPLFGKFHGSQVKIWKRREARNDFAPCFYGVLSPEGSGVRLLGRFGMDRTVRLFLAYFLTFGISITLLTLPGLVEHLTRRGHNDLSGFEFIPLGILTFGILMMIYGRRIGRREKGFLLDFLQSTLLARQEDGRFLVPQDNCR